MRWWLYRLTHHTKRQEKEAVRPRVGRSPQGSRRTLGGTRVSAVIRRKKSNRERLVFNKWWWVETRSQIRAEIDLLAPAVNLRKDPECYLLQCHCVTHSKFPDATAPVFQINSVSLSVQSSRRGTSKKNGYADHSPEAIIRSRTFSQASSGIGSCSNQTGLVASLCVTKLSSQWAM